MNECESNNGGCGQMCANTIGSFECSCTIEGYALAANDASCEGMYAIILVVLTVFCADYNVTA